MRLKSSPPLSSDKEGEADPGDLKGKTKGKDPQYELDSCYLQRDYIQKKFRMR